MAYLVSNAVYEVSLRHIATNIEDGDPDLDYTLTITPSGASANLATIVIDPDEIIGTKQNRPSVSWFTGKKAKIAVVKARILADLNRDGAIDETDATINAPLRMWVNDDHDSGAIADGESDVPGALTSLPEKEFFNNKDRRINGINDLEDFFPIWLDIGEAVKTLMSFDPSARLSVKSKSGNLSIGIVKTTLTASNAGDYLRDAATARSISRTSPGLIGASIPLLAPEDMATVASHPDEGVFLLEGRQESTTPLRIQLLYNKTPALTLELPVEISPVEDFFRWINLRHITGDDESRETDIANPSALPDNKTDGNCVVFLHGFNVNEREARGWNAEMFKRLWQSGCDSKYYAVTWCGDAGWPNELHYHEDVEKAFETASALATAMQPLTGDVTVLAHSLGNMVVSSAIQDHGFRPTRYFMFNAAVPAEAFDEFAWDDAALHNPMVHQEWVNYPSRTWAAKWHELFPVGDPRCGLSWTNRFASVPHLTELHNYYSSEDEVLSLFDEPDNGGAVPIGAFTGGAARNHSWQKQERFKGRASDFPGGLGGTSDMGWGFSKMGVWNQGNPPMYNPLEVGGILIMDHVRTNVYTLAQAAAATDAQLISDPVFMHQLTLGVPTATMTQAKRDGYLAHGIPALSGPAGSRTLEERLGADNYDTNDLSEGTWPRTSSSTFNGWRHGDVKAVALPYVFDIYSSITQSELGETE